MQTKSYEYKLIGARTRSFFHKGQQVFFEFRKENNHPARKLKKINSSL